MYPGLDGPSVAKYCCDEDRSIDESRAQSGLFNGVLVILDERLPVKVLLRIALSFTDDRLLDDPIFTVEKFSIRDGTDKHAAAYGQIAQSDLCLIQRRVGCFKEFGYCRSDTIEDSVYYPVEEQESKNVEVSEENERVA